MRRRSVYKMAALVSSAIVVGALAWGCRPFIDRQAKAQNPVPMKAAPLAAGDAGKLAAWIGSETNGIEAFIALRDGQVLMSQGAVDVPMNLASVRKSVMSLLFGIAWDRGLIDLDATLDELGIDESRTPLTAAEKRATVEQLLQARSGIYLQSGAETMEIKDGRPRRGQFLPGEHYFYNNWDFNVLGVVFERQTGLSIGQALESWLAVPLGMQDFSPEHVLYDSDDSGSDFGTYRIHMSARDLARLGTLVQRDGIWGRERIVSKEWLDRSTAPHSRPDSAFYDGFGYSWWLNSELDTVQADGWGGQFLLVDRDHDLVLVTRRDNGNSILEFLVFSQFKPEGHPADIQKLDLMLREMTSTPGHSGAH
ncbi:serine hydrolase domain-containing protein [Marilutibacter chinensis]|uniref:Beta-lactamase family protein n=1 Tax=Marilutibacter chinensis TaxID=2912247 RepID=A0ABS9HZS5_9GAMM|nr:serine hydrolase [Lysobacter chinensis]MCF7223639.1 beta-lactamase family protein [Lysobacter chinensis]